MPAITLCGCLPFRYAFDVQCFAVAKKAPSPLRVCVCVCISCVQEEADAIQDVFAESKVSDLTFGKHHTLAIGAHGLVFGWGKQSSGQVGTGLPFEYVCPPWRLLHCAVPSLNDCTHPQRG